MVSATSRTTRFQVISASYQWCFIIITVSTFFTSRKAFFHKNFSNFSSMNSSTNSESALLSNASPTQSITKAKHRDNKENKLQRFGGAFVSGGTLVFGKIKSLWSHSNANIGLNLLADADRLQKSKSTANLGLTFHVRLSLI